MSGITTGIGLFSGIDTASLINQLLAIDARPRDLAQQRILQLQLQQSAYLDINSKLSALRSATKAFRTDFIFDSMGATSSNDSVLSAVASRTATPGVYSFLVDRLVSSQQMLSKGFSDKDSTGVGATSFTFESEKGRLDRDTALADLNDGEGVERGKVVVTVGAETATIDLSKAVTVNDVLDAFNASGLDLTASVSGDHFVLTAGSGSESVSVTNATGYTTADSLGIAGSGTGSITGDAVYQLSANTTLNELNDGNGVFIADSFGGHDFEITVNGATAQVNLGSIYDGEDVTEGPVNTMQGVLDRINDALTTAGMDATVSVAIVGGALRLTDSGGNDVVVAESGSGSTAADLGILGTGTGGTLTGEKIFAGLNTTLVSNLNGGSGVAGDGTISFTARDGTSFSVDVSAATTTDELVSIVNNDSGNGGRITLSLNGPGSGLLVTDTTGASASNLIIAGDTAKSLGISTEAGGVAETSVSGTSLQHRYLSLNTRVAELNGGQGIGTGNFRITDGDSISFTVDIGSDTKTVNDLLKEINAQANAAGANILARINDKGDGILIGEDPSKTAGAGALSVADVSGAVAKNLKIAGEATGTGADNHLDGSAEVTVNFEPTATLKEIAQAVTDAGAGVRATIINDGTGSNPFRLSFTSTATGSDGRFIVDDGGFGLNLRTLDKGEDARVFYGSADPAKAVLLTSSVNTLDSVIPGVTIDLKGVSQDLVTVNVTRDNAKIEASINNVVTAYNALVDRIAAATRYDPETEAKGPLLGESTLGNLRSGLARTALAKPIGVDSQFQRLTDVGISFIDGGKLSLDRDKLRQAMEEDPQAVEDLFAAREQIPTDGETEIGDGIFVKNTSNDEQFSKLGVLFLFEKLGDDYLDSVDGILTTKDKTFTDKIDLQRKRVDQFNIQLEAKRQRLQTQFLAMEQALASLSSQQNALSSLQNLG